MKSDTRQEHDYYATHPTATKELLKIPELILNTRIWECCAGEGHISNILEQNGYTVYKTDIIERNMKLDKVLDFLQYTGDIFDGDIITNPPFKMAQQIVEKALSCIPTGNKVIMLLKLQFLESNTRKEFFKTNPPKYVFVARRRITCARDGKFEDFKNGSPVAYAWYIWEKGYIGDTILKWFN